MKFANTAAAIGRPRPCPSTAQIGSASYAQLALSPSLPLGSHYFEPCSSFNRSIEYRMTELFPGNLAESVKGRLLFAIPKKGSLGVGDKQRRGAVAQRARTTDVMLTLCLYREAI